MGAMIFGGVGAEHIQFNESTIWTGQPHCYDHDGAVNALPVKLPACGRAAVTKWTSNGKRDK